MSVHIKVKLRPFTVPNFVSHETPPGYLMERSQEGPKSALKDLDEETLAALCEEFTENVFAKAGKQRPKP